MIETAVLITIAAIGIVTLGAWALYKLQKKCCPRYMEKYVNDPDTPLEI